MFAKPCLHWKVISIIYSKCLSVALGIQHAMRMRRIISSPVACPALPCIFSTLSHKRHDLKKNVFNIQGVFIRHDKASSRFFVYLRSLKKSQDSSLKMG
jgi:hypothetical protein